MGFPFVTYALWSDVAQQQELVSLRQRTNSTEPRQVDMLDLLGVSKNHVIHYLMTYS